MLAIVHEIRVEILTKDIDGDYGCNNLHSLKDREDDKRKLIRIHAEGAHYSRCVSYPKEESPLGK